MSIIKFTDTGPSKKSAKERESRRVVAYDAVDKAMVKITLDEIAQAAGCSVSTLRQSRLAPGVAGYRSPPAGLQRALHELCKDQAKYFAELAEQLRPPKE